MTAAPHTLPAPAERSWRLVPASSGALVEAMVVVGLLLAVVFIGAAHARAARQSGDVRVGEAQLAAIAPAISAYRVEYEGYQGMTAETLARDYGIKRDGTVAGSLTITTASADSYCAQVRSGGWYVAERGPNVEPEASRQPICS